LSKKLFPGYYTLQVPASAFSMISEEQFIRLFARHEGELRAFAFTLMPCPADAEDVVQDACIAMWRRIGDLDKEESFRSWAYTFIRFTALNRIRKIKRSPLQFCGELVEILAEEGRAEADRANTEIRALATCLEKLPDAQAEIIRRYYASATIRMADVASSLARNTAGLYKSLERARESLKTCIRQALAEQGFDPAQGER
jgi:RNA polymerase sigma-70 factor (ECF subfamily)